ncbi:MAG: hypothetical protein PHR82_08095 [Endomicrobiaceae bacterium]|nr:hypothetical protein [Endomicrobiaceae bacterium]
MICSKKHRYLPDFTNLPYAQDDTNNDRHKCAGCAYVEGIKDSLNNSQMATSLSLNIPESQAGTVRHKDAYEAYKLGYERGEEIKN